MGRGIAPFIANVSVFLSAASACVIFCPGAGGQSVRGTFPEYAAIFGFYRGQRRCDWQEGQGNYQQNYQSDVLIIFLIIFAGVMGRIILRIIFLIIFGRIICMIIWKSQRQIAMIIFMIIL